MSTNHCLLHVNEKKAQNKIERPHCNGFKGYPINNGGQAIYGIFKESVIFTEAQTIQPRLFI